MRAQPAPSEVRRLAAQLVAYGGSRARSMHEERTHRTHRPITGTNPATGRSEGTTNPAMIQDTMSEEHGRPHLGEPIVRDRRTRRSRRPPGVPRTPPRAAGPTGAGGTATPTSTRASTATSSATTASCGAPRAWTRQEAELLGPADALKGRTVLEIGAVRRSARAGWPRRARVRWPSTCRTGSSSTPGASTTAPGASRWCRRTRAVLPFADGSFDLACSAYGGGAVRRRLRRGCCARCGGCCGPAGAGSSR